ncbi:MAG: cation diffusion facilitator family transporter [Pseudomonadales bacterium]
MNERYKALKKVTIIGSVADFGLGVSKVAVGVLANSQALVADGIHSFSDLATDFFVLYAAKHSNKEADAGHPYGHGRIETLATVVLGATLVLVALGIAFDAIQRLISIDAHVTPGFLALLVAGVSIASKEWIYHYTMRVAKKYKSDLLRANAWHSRSDAVSSVVVLIGIVGAMLGYPILDAVAAVVVAVMIAKIGFDLARSSSEELIDSALDEKETENLRQLMLKVAGVRAVHELRSRTSAGDAFVDVHIQVDPKLSVSEGHQIGDLVRTALLSGNDAVSDVTVHIDPEDDENEHLNAALPSRQSVIDALARCWPEVPTQDLNNVRLHFLSGSVHAELILPISMLSGVDDAEQYVLSLQENIVSLPYISELKVLFKPQ